MINIVTHRKVFPTCVGVSPWVKESGKNGKGIPHMRGGEPGIVVKRDDMDGYSPHAWG